MGRAIFFIIFSVFFALPLIGQVRVSKLVVKAKEVYELGQSDILVADTLVMMDSSRIVLNHLKQDNFIRVKMAILGNACIIDGSGTKGQAGRKGRDGDTLIGPCKNGTNGREGAKGLDGVSALNLYLYFTKLTIKGKIFINLIGGDGGNGGNGGNGGGGSPGTVHCDGGNGGNGGSGSPGGNGGDGGTLTLSCSSCQYFEGWIGTRIIIANSGGSFVVGGIGGFDRPAG